MNEMGLYHLSARERDNYVLQKEAEPRDIGKSGVSTYDFSTISTGTNATKPYRLYFPEGEHK